VMKALPQGDARGTYGSTNEDPSTRARLGGFQHHRCSTGESQPASHANHQPTPPRSRFPTSAMRRRGPHQKWMTSIGHRGAQSVWATDETECPHASPGSHEDQEDGHQRVTIMTLPMLPIRNQMFRPHWGCCSLHRESWIGVVRYRDVFPHDVDFCIELPRRALSVVELRQAAGGFRVTSPHLFN
jgi:hypothetical protein